MENEFDNEEYLNSLPPGIREDMESGDKGAWTLGPAEVAAGAVIAPQLIKPAVQAWGVGKVAEVVSSAAFPDAEDNKFDKFMEAARPLHPLVKPAKETIKATRLLYEEIGKSIFDQRLPNTPEATSGLLQALHQHPQIGKLSKLQKQTDNRNILDQYLHKKAVEGPHKAWEDQGIPQGEMTSSIDAYRMEKHGRTGPYDLQGNEGYSYRKGRPLKNPIYDNLSPKVQKGFTDAGIDSDKATFFIENWTREVGANVEGFPFTDRTFEFMQSELLPKILEDMKGIDLSDGLQLDHIAQLKAMTPFYQGRNLKQAERIRRILIKEGIFGGHNPKNLKYLPTNVHTVKTNFWRDQVGDAGEKFFEGRKMDTYADVEKAAKEMKVFINRSNDIVDKVSAQYRFMRKKNITADELESVLEKVDLNYGTYNLKEVRALIKEISTDSLKRSQQGTELLEEAIDAQSAKDSPLPYLTEDNPFPTRTPIKRRTKIKKPKFKKTDKNQTELDL